MKRLFLWCILLVAIGLGAARADVVDSRRWFEGLTPEDRTFVQFSLIWTGHYNGFVDRTFSARFYRAVIAYQASIGDTQNGVMTHEASERLFAEALQKLNATGFELVQAPFSDFRLGVPKRLVSVEHNEEGGHSWAAPDDSFSIEAFDYPEERFTYDRLFQRFSSNSKNRRVDYARDRQSFFVTNGLYKGRQFYVLVHRMMGRSRGLVVAWSQERHVELWPVVTAMASAFNLPLESPSSSSSPPSAPQTLPPSQIPPPALGTVTGSGFFIDTLGHVVTNHHVVGQCRKVTVVGVGEASILNMDPNNDLALLRVANPNKVAARLRKVPLLLAEPVAVVGYPYSGILSSLNITLGNVSALTGIGNDTREFQLTAAVQPGNSGGPVVDAKGDVVGVVQARLDDVAVLEKTKSIPQNVNFAIRSETLATFLSANGIAFSEGVVDGSAETTSTIAPAAVKEAVLFTAQILCDQ